MNNSQSKKMSPLKKASPKQKGKEKPGLRLVFQDCIKPAPLAIKPFSSFVNPFRQGCSIFCNHPTKDAGLKKAIEKTKRKKIDDEREAEIMGRIIEDIIYKYGTQSIDTETLIATTPESEVLPPPPRPQLVLNLRTISQEAGRSSGGLQSTLSPSPPLSGQNVKVVSTIPVALTHAGDDINSKSETEEECSPEPMKRRGKVRKKKKKPNSETEKGEKEVTDLIEPNDTMVSTCRVDGTDYESEDYDIERSRSATKCPSSQPTPPLMESDLFDNRTLRHLRRNLSVSDIQAEFRRIWRRVLEEALGAGDVLPHCEVKIEGDIKIYESQPENWLSYPRTFKHSDSRFDLPINKKILRNMKPLEYLKQYVSSSKKNLLLYNHVYNKYKKEDELLSGEVIIDALGEVMGHSFDEEEAKTFKELVELREEDQICLKTWLGLCAFAERLFGEKFSAGKAEGCGEREIIEILDFECLEKRLPKLDLNPAIARLLKAIQGAIGEQEKLHIPSSSPQPSESLQEEEDS